MPPFDPHDELGVSPGASREEIERAYRRTVVQRHRKGVWRIVAQLRRAHGALSSLSDPAERAMHQRTWHRDRAERSDDHATRQGRKLALLGEYKQRLAEDAERMGRENARRHAAAFAELDVEEQPVDDWLREPRRAMTGWGLVLLPIVVAVLAAAWLHLRGGG